MPHTSAIDKALDDITLTPENAYVIRKIRPLLPSYSAEFTATVISSGWAFDFPQGIGAFLTTMTPMAPILCREVHFYRTATICTPSLYHTLGGVNISNR
jgi:hypothetical protein